MARRARCRDRMAGMAKIQGSFCERTVKPKRFFDRRSFRWVKSGQSWVLIGCPRGKFEPKGRVCTRYKKTRRGKECAEYSEGRCKVGTRAHKVLARAKKGARCEVGKKVRK